MLETGTMLTHSLDQCTRVQSCACCCMAFRVYPKDSSFSTKMTTLAKQDITNSVTICEAPHLCNSFLSFSSVSVFPSYRLDCLYVVRSTSWLYPYYICTIQGSRSSNHATLSRVDLDCVPMVIAEGHVPSAAD